jgi:membrane fusion protein, multidrug efflux system
MKSTERAALAVLLSAGLAGCGGARDGGSGAIPVRTWVVEPSPVTRVVVLPCRLEGSEEAVISVSTPATVTGVFVSEGDRVGEGDLLVALETDGMHEAEVAAAAARYSAATAALDYQRDRLDRTAGLLEAGAVTSSFYEQAEADAGTAEATAELALTAYMLASSEASTGQVRAPFDGTVSRVWAREGNPAGGSLVALSNGGVLEAALMIAPVWLRDIVPGLPVMLETPLYPGEIFQGNVIAVSPSIDPLSGLGTARVQFDDCGGKLRTGMGCTATVALETVPEAVVVPQSAMDRDASGAWRVAVVEGGIARFRQVSPGIRNGFEWQILQGLSVGDTIVVMGINRLSDGSPVREAGV